MNNKVLGAGKCYFDAEDDAGNLTGERYLGDTPALTENVSVTKVEDYDSDEALAQKDVSVATQIVRGGKLTIKDISLDNAALFYAGGVQVVNQAATPVVDEDLGNCLGDRYYQLGATAANPSGVRNVSAVTVKAAGVAAVVNTDYTVDAPMGRVYIVAGGACDGADVTVSYTPVANTRSQVVTGAAKTVAGAFRFIADNTLGENHDRYAPKAHLTPNGDLTLKDRQTISSMSFDIEYLKSDRGEALYIDGRPA